MITMAAAISSTLAEILHRDPNAVIVGCSVRSGGVAGTSAGLLDRFGAERVIEVPIGERAAMGFALGLALAGKRPFVELDATHALLGALEALAEAAAIAGDGEFTAPIVVRVPYGGEAGPRVDRAVADLLASIPGIAIAVPSSAAIAAGLLRAASTAIGPVVLLEPRALYGERGDDHGAVWPIGTARLAAEGGDVTLATWGLGVAAALEIAETLAAEGVRVDVIDLVSLAPIDRGLLADRLRVTGRLVVVDPGDGMGDRVVRAGLDAFEWLEAPPITVAIDGALGAVRDALAF